MMPMRALTFLLTLFNLASTVVADPAQITSASLPPDLVTQTK